MVNPTVRYPSKPKVMITPLSIHERVGWYYPKLVWWLMAAMIDEKYRTTFHPAHNVHPAAAARNLIAQIAVKNGFDWLCMVDNDMHPPMNLLRILDNAPESAGVILPLFHLWDDKKNGGIRACWVPWDDNLKEKQLEIDSLPELMRLRGVGSGCLFIRPSVFTKLDYPYFKYEWDENGQMTMTEDVYFYNQCLAAGIEIWGNTKFTVGHYHNVDLALLPSILGTDEQTHPASEQ